MILSLLGSAGIAEAGPKPPYCSDRCAPWRPCNKVCRQADGGVTTCGEYGLCKPPDPVVFEPEEPPPPPPCPNNAARCERDGRFDCPAVPGFTLRAASADGLTVRFERRPEGVADGSSFVWKFASAQEGRGPVTVYPFDAPGRYRVTLEVTEGVCGTQQSRTETIEVPPLLEIPPQLPDPEIP